jgi:excinuclease ABC subunit C
MFVKPDGIPRSSGCYLFRNAMGTIIYVGKAKVLQQRLSSYFQKAEALTPKTQALMVEAASVEWIVTPTENDALLLENELIKVNQPRYNMRLKDDKSYPFVAIDSRSAFPVPYITRGKHVKGVRYYGPFVDVRALRATMEELLQIFPLRSCTSAKFVSHQRQKRPCLLYDIGKCSGPCVGAVDAQGYADLVSGWSRFFDGDVRQLRTLLTNRMNDAAENKKYEAAAKFRDGLLALDRADKSQSVILDDRTSLDVITVATDGGRAALVHFRVRHGRIVGRNVQMADRSLDETSAEIFDALVTSAFASSDVAPTVLTDSATALCEWAPHYLSSRRGRPVSVTVPQRGKRLALLALAQRDAQSVINRDSLRRQADHNVRARALQELGDALGLDQPPYRIECFDMSHLQGTNYVGSMVVFEDGLPIKNQYRHFNVKEILGNDDAGAMEEVVRRRLGYWGEDVASSKFRRANLLIIDGGLPQLHAAQIAAANAGVSDSVELVALAKREELLYRPGSSQPIALERGSESLYLVQRIRDEAHRFAISFHRSKRAKSMIATVFDGVPGLGSKRRDRLLLEMGSLDNLRQATLEELNARSWLPAEVAKSIYDHLRAPAEPKLRRERDND